MPQMPVCQADAEGQRALQGSWEHMHHIRYGTVRRARQLKIEKKQHTSNIRGKTRENSSGAFGAALSAHVRGVPPLNGLVWRVTWR